MHDIIIVGGGIVGSVCALLLAQNASLQIAVLDTKPHLFKFNEHQYDDRLSAISLTSQNIFKEINIWPAIEAKRVSPYHRMYVWDYLEEGFIQFDSESLLTTELGYIIEDNLIKSCLMAELNNRPNIDYFAPVTPIQLQQHSNHVDVILNEQMILSAPLIIGADGAFSWVRAQAKIEVALKDYGHTAIIATVTTEKPHDKTAWQRFLPGGPLAFLPLVNPHLCSIVWSCQHEEAKKLIALPDEAFKIELAKQFNHRLGQIHHVSKRSSFPLYMRHSKHYVSDHIALIGDAAHTIHPLAGQGLNLGLKDALALSETIIKAHTSKRNFAKAYTLRQYERARRSDTMLMLNVVETLKQLFACEHQAIERVRNRGLTLLNRLPFIKNYLAEYASGTRAIAVHENV